MHSVNILLTELLWYCFFYPFSSTVTMFPVSVILKVLGHFNPDSAKGELLIPQETLVLQCVKEKYLTYNPIPLRVSSMMPQHISTQVLTILYFFTSIKNKHNYNYLK